ncbi:MAG: DEAD/DEAH box helicase [Candidatus Cyclobacteriaceae bacterium M3_2C_046]
MKVSTNKPFKIIYSVFEHEYLGYIFESFVVQLDENHRLTLQHQNISSQNAEEFALELDEVDYKLIKIMDSMQQNVVIRFFYGKKVKPAEFFQKVYEGDKPNQPLIDEIERYLERRRSEILPLLKDKMLFEMGNDGEPTWKPIEIQPEKATVLFHFRRNEDNTHYFPTLKYQSEKIEYQYNGSYIICKEPAWLVARGKLYNFEKDVDGHKLIPFLNKKFIVIPKKVEDTYYRKFVAPLIASFDVYAKGFDIVTEKHNPVPLITISELVGNASKVLSLFDNDEPEEVVEPEDEKMLFELAFRYGKSSFKADNFNPVSVSVEKNDDTYRFQRIRRNTNFEKKVIKSLNQIGLVLKNSRSTMLKREAFNWLSEYNAVLHELGIQIAQSQKNKKMYFLGESSIKVEVRENIDWFDIYAVITFGPYQISLKELRRIINKKSNEVELPNGEIAVIPEYWINQYSELFAFMEEKKGSSTLTLKKHHLALVQDLEKENLASLTINRKLEKLKGFEQIDDHPIPLAFRGELRPYQKAGYNWLKFLNKFNFGGCLADDMGLGKTVQTLAMLQAQKEEGINYASLLIMPTSLIYNWEMESRKFTPLLKIFNYTGTNRVKDASQFEGYDLVITTYGITRLDVNILNQYYFHYIILDESQAIKNPASNIAKAVRKLKSKHKLILTGTPLENSTLDLWSQMTFINPGLLGSQSFFKNEFLQPIEKNKDAHKTHKLNAIIKPFILRRHKSQVATELPDKVINVQYCTMTAMQEEQYNEMKSYYRNKILDQIESKGLKGSQFLLLQGLSKLRQLANHPKMIDPDYKGDSGKLEDVMHMVTNGISEGHKILIFSQFVKHLTIMQEYLQSINVNYAYLDGATKDRQAQVESFQNDENIRIFLISLKAGGLGLNLTKADYVFLLDPWWNPAVEAQAIDRAHRIGQENRVFTYKFISKHTVEEKILTLQQRKLHLAHELITTEESFVKELSKEDIESLFD